MENRRFFLGHIFDDSEQTESILHSQALNLYFVLKLDGLSYCYDPELGDVMLIQWRFLSNKLHIETESKTYVFSLNKVEDSVTLNVLVAVFVDKKMLEKRLGKMNVMESIDSKMLEKFITNGGKLAAAPDTKKMKTVFIKLLSSIIMASLVIYVLVFF